MALPVPSENEKLSSYAFSRHAQVYIYIGSKKTKFHPNYSPVNVYMANPLANYLMPNYNS